jgi:glycine betaine/choline ABC-type transport system substrate-binding protein
MKDQGSLFRGAPAFPFHTSVREVIAPFIYDAIAGKISNPVMQNLNARIDVLGEDADAVAKSFLVAAKLIK